MVIQSRSVIFYSIDLTPAYMKVKMASIHFGGHASTWHQSVRQSAVGGNLLYDWSCYKTLLKEKFEDICDDPIAELKQLQETNGIVEYHEKFELIKNKG